MSKKEKFALYLTPEKKARLERRYQEDGSRSITGFIERAIDFYLDYLSANNAGLFLPTSIQSYLDGRVGQLENKMASLAYKQAVELDMKSGGSCKARLRISIPRRSGNARCYPGRKSSAKSRTRSFRRRIHEIHRHP